MITGASGNIGTALLRELEPSWEVTGIARRIPDLVAEPYAGVSWLQSDLGEPGAADELARAFDGADAVVHLAWAISPAWDEPAMWRTNENGTRHVLDAAAKAGVGHLVCASSVAAYGPGPREEKVGEEFPRTGIPASAYSRGKAELEAVLDAFAEAHPAIGLARIRPCAVVQQGAAGEFTRWLLGPVIPPGLLGRRLLPVPLWEGLRVQAVHAEDVASALRLIVEQRATGPFNLAAPDVLDAKALAGIIGGLRLPVRKSVTRFAARVAWTAGLQPLHPGWLELADRAALVDTTRAEMMLGWQPRHSTRETVTELIGAVRDKVAGASPPLARASTGLKSRVRALGRLRPTRQSQA